MADPTPARASVARMSLALLAVVAVCALAVDLLARNEPLAAWVHGRYVERWKGADLIAPQEPYLYRPDRLFFELIPGTDHSRGGVYFFGASNLATAEIPWELPPEERALVHNYSLGGVSLTSLLHLTRYMVEYQDWPAPGGRSLVVFTLFWGNAKDLTWMVHAFPHGTHAYDPERGIHPTGLPEPLKLLIRERVRCRAFLRTFERIGLNDEGELDLRPLRGIPPLTKTEFLDRWRSRMGDDWEQDMSAELESLAQAIDLLRAHDARAALVLLPIGSWSFELPYHEAFAERIARLSAEKAVPLTDLTHALSDDEFVPFDNLHQNHAGSLKVHELLMRIAREHLRRIEAPGPARGGDMDG